MWWSSATARLKSGRTAAAHEAGKRTVPNAWASCVSCWAAASLGTTRTVRTPRVASMTRLPSPLGWFDDLLYVPETLYVLILFWLICSGPGNLSVDHTFGSQLQK